MTQDSDNEVLGENEKAMEKTNLGMNFGSIRYRVITGKSLSFSELQFPHL